MPLEGHYQRVNTPLRRLTGRERGVIAVVLTITVVAILALALAPASDSASNSAAGPGCIYTVVAGRTGGEPVHGCGAEAEAICAHAARFDDPRADKIVASCEAAGVPTNGKPGGPFSISRLR
jgi:hypothetical protein